MTFEEKSSRSDASLYVLSEGGQLASARVALEHEAEKACPGLDPGGPGFRKTSCSNNKLKRDAGLKRRHVALMPAGAAEPDAEKRSERHQRQKPVHRDQNGGREARRVRDGWRRTGIELPP